MINDQFFINESDLKKILNLSQKSDPFIIQPTIDTELEIKKNVINRLIISENILI